MFYCGLNTEPLLSNVGVLYMTHVAFQNTLSTGSRHAATLINVQCKACVLLLLS